MLSVVVLISGTGSNLQALIDAANHNDFPARIIAVGADRDAAGLHRAHEHGIPTFTVPFGDYADRATWGDALVDQIECYQPGLVVLSGFMRLLPPRTVAAFAPRLVNTHPAYLPEFPGAHAVRDALEAGVEQTGASLIVVNDGVDTGPIIAQERVDVEPGDTEETLHNRIKPVERRLLIQAVRDIATRTIEPEELADS